ncbi:hypothetical protein, partial [Agrobacterium vitis]|uniref:hypothetical protein n=1 Tax=Agrobacterium vitis TaxID=373 RepID=UPI001AEE87FE
YSSNRIYIDNIQRVVLANIFINIRCICVDIKRNAILSLPQEKRFTLRKQLSIFLTCTAVLTYRLKQGRALRVVFYSIGKRTIIKALLHSLDAPSLGKLAVPSYQWRTRALRARR